uniref:Uncharacterized protein n=1 Tax=Leersia perrieri TaxID=77586 RepID=A0A0D9VB35_9ORYZ
MRRLSSSCLVVPREQPQTPPQADDADIEPQTATCCTALHRADGQQPRFAPVRTPASAAAAALASSSSAPITYDDKAKKSQKQVRKCKSTVQDAPCLRRSGAVRRDWSFEDLRANNAA